MNGLDELDCHGHTILGPLPSCSLCHRKCFFFFYGICLYLQNRIFSMYFVLSTNNSMVLISVKCSILLWFLLSSPKWISALRWGPGIQRASIELAHDLPPEAQMLQVQERGNFTFVLSAPEPVSEGLIFFFFISFLTFESSALDRRVAQPQRVCFWVGRILAAFCQWESGQLGQAKWGFFTAL